MKKRTRILGAAAYLGFGLAYRSMRLKKSDKDLSYPEFQKYAEKHGPGTILTGNEKVARTVWAVTTYGVPALLWPVFAARRAVGATRATRSD